MKVFDPDKTEKRQLLVWICWASVLISLVSVCISLFMSIGLPIVHLSLTALVIFMLLAIIIKRGLGITFSEFLWAGVTLFFVNVLWYHNYGHNGPALFMFLVLFSIIIFIWNKKKLIIGTVIILINLSVLFYLEYTYPGFAGDYQTPLIRIVDMYSTLLMLFVMFYAIMFAVKRSYMKEYDRAKQSDQLKSSFLENINHEVRTPLNAIIGFSSLIAEETITREQAAEYGELIAESNESLLRIIDDIMLVSSLESGSIHTKMKECDLDNLISSLLKASSSLLVKKKKEYLKLNISEPNISDTIFADKIRIQQVFLRLMDNAIKFTDKGSITFGYRVETSNVVFHIADSGTGISYKHGDRIFDRFYKIKTKTHNTERGTGVGLYISKKIVESMNGKIWYNSDSGHGTTFYFSIPRTKTLN